MEIKRMPRFSFLKVVAVIFLFIFMTDALAHGCHRRYRHRHRPRCPSLSIAMYSMYPVSSGDIWATQCGCIGGPYCCGGYNADFQVYSAQPWQFYETSCSGWYYNNSDWVSSDYNMIN